MLRDSDPHGSHGRYSGKEEDLGHFNFAKRLQARYQLADWSDLLQSQNAPDNWRFQLADSFRSAISNQARKDEILPLITAGSLLFNNIAGISDHDAARVHSDSVLTAQAYAMALNTRNPCRIIGYTLITHLTHMLDDYLDQSEQIKNRELFRFHRNDIIQFLENWGESGILADKIKEHSPWIEGYYDGLKRIFYGALITHSTPAEQEMYLQEYMNIVNENLSPLFRDAIKDIRPLCYSLTNKTVCQVCPMDAAIGDFDAAELRSLCFAPALLLMNLRSEVSNGELNYFGQAPSVQELSEMINVSRKMLPNVTMDFVLFQEQFEFVMDAFEPMLPGEIKKTYKIFGEALDALVS